MTPGAGESGAADFARRFAEFWEAPSPERLAAVLAPRVRRWGATADGVSYFDPAPIAFAVARRPRAWPGFGRLQLRRLSR